MQKVRRVAVCRKGSWTVPPSPASLGKEGAEQQDREGKEEGERKAATGSPGWNWEVWELSSTGTC